MADMKPGLRVILQTDTIFLTHELARDWYWLEDNQGYEAKHFTQTDMQQIVEAFTAYVSGLSKERP